ncbi:MAG: 16S rRNA (cytidine(1402)-2'-O)-methyltransferase [Bacteroidota bacterium]
MGKIVLVPTPIGNLEDMTLRAIRVLREADLIAAEDTRKTGVLLKHFEISTSQTSLHQHNEHQRIPSLLEKIQQDGLTLAVVSDAGTPGISDPGFLLVRAAREQNIPVEVLPGPTAFIPALVASGLPCDKFTFEGFLPQKKGRKSRLEALAQEDRTLILYESPHKLTKTLLQLAEYLGENRPAFVGREISKIHETHYPGTLGVLSKHFEESEKPKGEFVIIIGPGKP